MRIFVPASEVRDHAPTSPVLDSSSVMNPFLQSGVTSNQVDRVVKYSRAAVGDILDFHDSSIIRFLAFPAAVDSGGGDVDIACDDVDGDDSRVDSANQLPMILKNGAIAIVMYDRMKV
mmetsp:Transcript_36664/g.76943  ORF Transcript_36664/g.76943 Transcript_36664/m.76943 type:complete len:118 (+) Transcript_36664:348-701(+)